MIYQEALKYARNQSGGWLTQGVREVRTILGYSGLVRLSSQSHLILIPGFELERAQEIVDAVHPSRITLGHATDEGSVSASLLSGHQAFASRLEALCEGTAINHFFFSSVDPFVTRDRVLEISCASDENTVVACLNTKQAMIGVALAALVNPILQLVYAQPTKYNVTGYSMPSGNVQFFELPHR